MSETKSEQIGPLDWVSEKVRERSCRRAEMSVWRVIREWFRLFERTWFIEEPRAGIARVEKSWRSDSSPRCTELLLMFWELDLLCVLEMRSEYFSMNAVIIQNDRDPSQQEWAIGKVVPWPNPALLEK